MDWKRYKRKPNPIDMRPWDPGADAGIAGHPGDMIARDPDNHADQWLVVEDFFKKNYEQEPE